MQLALAFKYDSAGCRPKAGQEIQLKEMILGWHQTSARQETDSITAAAVGIMRHPQAFLFIASYRHKIQAFSDTE